MQPEAIWIIYTLMFGYPVPTHDAHEFTNRAACEIHKHSYSEQIVEAFQLVCSTKWETPPSESEAPPRRSRELP